MEDNKKNRNRNFTLLFYPEDETHKKALEYVEKNFDYAWILHDKDVTENGELKKPHIHCVIRVGTIARWRSSVAEELGISLAYIEGCSLKKQLRYLIHFDNDDKHKYDIEEVHGNLKKKLIDEIEGDTSQEDEKVAKMIFYIETSERIHLNRKFCFMVH